MEVIDCRRHQNDFDDSGTLGSKTMDAYFLILPHSVCSPQLVSFLAWLLTWFTLGAGS